MILLIKNNKKKIKITDIPDLMVLTTERKHEMTIFLTQCKLDWDERHTRDFAFIKFACLYVGPLSAMSFFYYRIILVLWSKEIPGHNCEYM